ncbi:hypothetical protein SAMN05216308_101665 [Nitrosospira sp. Nsp13]|nr:hypothetical protein SAMN05216308_101665 [Nitrosospira sp. Nsp13]
MNIRRHYSPNLAFLLFGEGMQDKYQCSATDSLPFFRHNLFGSPLKWFFRVYLRYVRELDGESFNGHFRGECLSDH